MLRRGLPCAYSRYDVSDGLARTPLDPIEVTPINISAARKWLTARFAVEALDILDHEEVFRTRCLAPPPEVTTWRNGKAVDTWYSRHHLPDLLKYGVIERMQERPPISCGYFAVEKTETASRAIFNGIPISEICRVPPPVHLSESADCVEFYRSLEGRPHVAALDFRHWFHQLPLGRGLRKYFAVKAGDGLHYQWRRLPMGWSWSPWIAQALSYGIVYAACERLGLSDQLPPSDSLPYFLALKRGDADYLRVYITYDNIGIFGNGPLVKELLDAVLQMCRTISCEVKEKGYWEYKVLRKPSESPCVHLGVQYRVSDSGQRIISIAEKTMDRWKRFVSQIEKRAVLSRREVARAVGIAIVDCRVRLRALCTISAIIEIGTENATGAVTTKQWDEPSQVNPAVVISFLLPIVTNPLSTLRKLGKGLPVLLAADASGFAGGYWAIDRDRVTVCVGSFPLNPVDIIYIKELHSALAGIRKVLENTTGPVKIFLLEDNAAAAFAVARLYTTNAVGNCIVQEIQKLLEVRNSSVFVVSIPSEYNPSDGLSRGRTSSVEMFDPFMRLLEGLGYVPFLRNSPMKFGGLRHDQDDLLDHAGPAEDGSESE